MSEQKGDPKQASPEIVFKKQPEGGIHWVEAAKDLESARARVLALEGSFPDEYIIVNQRTGGKATIVVGPDSDDQP